MKNNFILKEGIFMKKFKTSQKVISCFLVFAMSVVCLSQAVIGFSSTAIASPKNRVDITTIDDNHAQLHFDNAISENRDILFTKQESEKGFHYIISDMDNQKELSDFNSTQNINLNQTQTENNNEVNALAWAIFNSLKHGGNVYNEVAKVIGPVAASQAWSVIKDCIAAAQGTSPIVAIPILVSALSSSQVIMLAVGAAGIA